MSVRHASDRRLLGQDGQGRRRTASEEDGVGAGPGILPEDAEGRSGRGAAGQDDQGNLLPLTME